MRIATLTLTLTALITLAPFQLSLAETKAVRGDPIVIQVIDLDYADANQLAAVLAPLLSPEGRIVAYRRTNSLIIKDRASKVKRLVEIIKGPINKSEHP
jgi:type II secretory pathway component GspD/PulD (secretin)